MKTNELMYEYLDWAVAKCEGENSVAACYYSDDNTPLYLDESPEPEWKPSTNWAQGGPIIEREGICFGKLNAGYWLAFPEANADTDISGPTPLIAAMRCYVASKLGDDVEIPLELL